MTDKSAKENWLDSNAENHLHKIFNVDTFKTNVQKIKAGGKDLSRLEIDNLLSMEGMITHSENKTTKRVIISECAEFEYKHERITAEKLIGVNYDVIFVPRGYFNRHEKRFDIFLCRGHIFLEADLKCITSCNPDTISKRIKNGSEQSSRLVLDMHSNIKRKDLIEGIKSGCERNAVVKEVLLFFNSRFYCLPKNQILSKKIYDIIK